MYYELYCDRHKTQYCIKCYSITDAYHYYLRHFSTIGDWIYYLRVAHTFLHKVKNEQTMIAIFHNVFKESFLIEVEKSIDNTPVLWYNKDTK